MPSFIPIGTSIKRNINKFLSIYLQSVGIAYFMKICTKEWTSCEMQTKMKDVTITFNTG